MLRHLLPTREDAEDVFQEAVVHAYVGLRALRRPDLFAPWLRTIAFNRAMLWQRRRYREERRRPRLWCPPTAGAEAAQAETRVDVHAILGILRPADRSMVVLRYAEDRDPAEIAMILGMTAGSVRVRLHRARRLLRAAYLGRDKEAGEP